MVVDATPPADDSADPLDVAFSLYLRRCDEGKVASRDEFLGEFPDAIADQLRELIEAADRIGSMTQVAPGVRPAADVQNGMVHAGANTPTAETPTANTPGGDPAGADHGAVTDNRTGEILADRGPHQAPEIRPGGIGAAHPGAETLAGNVASPNDSGVDMNATLPTAGRQKGDHGPTLPFDLGDYVLVEVLGRGGMGIVYLADQKELQRHVAVKMIRSGILASEAEVRRFYTEAQAAARLHHPNIVSVYQFGRRADHHFFSMEYVRGTDLQKKINGETLNPHVAARYVRDVALAIHHAHEKGVLHRDLKPANVLIDPDDHVHVTDFGLAKHIDADSSVTGSGDAVGTPHYMAPEQAVGQSDRATATSDVYSMGAILFAALAGRPPIVGDTVMQTLVNVVHQPPPLLRSLRPEVPADLETIVAKCLEKEPHRRYGSALELADELDRFLIGDPIVARPRSAPIKAFQWLTGVPLFGALAGRRVLNASVSHRRFQAAMLSMMFLVPVILISALLYRNHMRDSMPADVVIAGGIEDGMYNDMSQQISRVLTQKTGVNAFSIPTGGSVENRDRLLAGEFDLAPMQATAVLGDDICVVAPLFYEVIYVLAHQDGGVTSIDDLRGHTIAVGPPTSGSQYSAQLIFESLGIKSSEIQLDQRSWSQLGQGQVPDAAIMCLGKGNALVNQMLASGKWKLLPITQGIEIALDHPTLRQMRIDAQHHPGVGIPESGVATVGTTAFLAARVNAPGELIRATLETLYEQAWSDDMIPKRIAAEWRGLDFHPEARRFFAESVAAGDP